MNSSRTYIYCVRKQKVAVQFIKRLRIYILNRKVFIKLSKPEPLRTKVKNSKKWSFNDFLGFPTPYTNIVM